MYENYYNVLFMLTPFKPFEYIYNERININTLNVLKLNYNTLRVYQR